MTRVAAGLAFLTFAVSPCRPPAQRLAERADVTGSSRSVVSSGGDSVRVVTRRVWAGDGVDMFGSPSPDGRYLSFTDWETGDLAVRDLVAGQNRRVTDQGAPYSQGFAEASVFSPDGRQIAYAWANEKDGGHELRVIAPDGSALRVLLSQKDEVTSVQPTGWSPDGRQIVARLTRRDRSNEIALISADSGPIRVLKTFDWRYPRKMTFSPDGRFIAYDFPPTEDSPARDVYVLAADASREAHVVTDPANDVLLGWTPDGQGLLLSSDRTGAPGVWRLPLADGRLAGGPELIRPEVWGLVPIGSARNGYFYGVTVEVSRVHTATVDVASGQVLSGPAAVTATSDARSGSPDWSPDGQRLAYIVKPLRTGPLVVAIQSVGTGDVRELTVAVESPYNARWTPDGRSLIVSGRQKGRYGLFRVDLESGRTVPLTWFENYRGTAHFALSPDGKTVYFVDHVDNKAVLKARDLVGGGETRLAAGHHAGTMGLSSDGALLAFSEWDSTSNSYGLQVMPAHGGEVRTVYRLRSPDFFHGSTLLLWTPDGRGILFVKGRDGSSKELELWHVSISDGQGRKLLSMPNLYSVRMHPDGRLIAFSGGESKAEIWVMEHLSGASQSGSQGASVSGERPAGVVTRRVWAQAEDLSGSPSPDGRYLSFTDWETGDLAVRDLVTGQNRRVTNKGTWESSGNEFTYASVFSPDGRRIAYSWQNKAGVCELRVISLAGGAPQVLFSRPADVKCVQPTGWSPDGHQIVAALWRRDRSRQIALISVDHGAVRVLKSFDWREPRRMSFSPDGQYIAYDFPPSEESPRRDIFVLAADASRETRVGADRANDVLLGWSPGGHDLLFASARSGAPGVWRMGVAEGKPVASPELVRPELWGLEPMGSARNGYFYAVAVEVPRVYTVSLDLATGQVLSAPRAVTMTPQAESSSPDWSPDGQRLAYIVRPVRGGRPLVAVQSVGSADVRELSLDFEGVDRARWAPDGRALLLTGHRKGRYGLHRVDLETGSTTYVDPAGFYSALSPGRESDLQDHVRLRRAQHGADHDARPP